MSIDLALGFLGVEMVYLNSVLPELDLTLMEGMAVGVDVELGTRERRSL